ncbi:GPALPP motifs-containing protein 1 [Anthophora retusa]
MDSDSESQDSDEGRRFRFEATRKDNVHPDSKLEKLSRSKSEQESSYNSIDHEDKKDKSKHNCSRGEHRLSKERDVDNRDLKYSTKYSKHSLESKNSRREDNKDHRSVRDVSSDTKYKTRDTKRHKNRDRNEHRNNRSQERSRSRNENDRSQNEKHRNKPHEKYKHHTRDKSYQSYKMRSLDHGKFRGESERHNTHKKLSTKEDEGQRLQEYPSPKSIGQSHSGNELLTKKDFSVESQEYNELNLSEFDILSETDENMSDSSDVKSKNSYSRQHNTKKRHLSNEYENSSKKQAIEMKPVEGSPKVNARKNDALYGSSNNNSGTISDSSLDTTSPILTESRQNTVDSNNKEENLTSTVKTSLHLNNCDTVKATDIAISSSHMHVKVNTTYGPVLPPQLATNSSNDTKSEGDTHFIGPCLPKNDAQEISEKKNEEDTPSNINPTDAVQQDSALDSDIIFGPALPPHLLKQKCNNDETNTKIIGPTFPNNTQSFNNNEVNPAESENEDEDEDGIGPLPANHPALESNHVYKQLEQRAQRIKSEQQHENYSTLTQREEWMTELPPTQTNNLGLTSRKFRIKEGPDMSDRSCWTDTPAKKAEKQKHQEEEKLYDVKTSTRELSEENDQVEYRQNRKCEKSLLEIHENKLRKKKRKEEKEAKTTGQTIRRPFDRDIDLQINRFDQAQKNAIIHKAQYLDERFSRGKF